LSVAEWGNYEWRHRPPSARAVRHAWLTEQIPAVRSASRGTYGARTVHAELTLALALQASHNQVELLMGTR
jgi:putative transposase